MSDIATIITASATLVTAFTALTSVLLNARRIREVHDEVKTGNSQTMAQLADATESRRIGHIPKKDRTRLEKSHLHNVKPQPKQ